MLKKTQIKHGQSSENFEYLARDYSDNQKLFHRGLKTRRKPRKNNLKDITKEEGNIFTDEEKFMDIWKTYFQTL